MDHKQRDKKEMIVAYLQRDAQALTVARYAMREAEEAFKLASKEYMRAQTERAEHLEDLTEIMFGFEDEIPRDQIVIQFED